MRDTWTFGRTMAAGFAAVLALNVTTGLIALQGLHSALASKDRVIAVDARLETTTEQLLTSRANRSAAVRGYLLTGDTSFRDQALAASADFTALIGQMQALVHTERGRALLSSIVTANADGLPNQNALLALRAKNPPLAKILAGFRTVAPQRLALGGALADFSAYEQQLASDAVAASNAAAGRDVRLIVGVLLATVVATIALAVLLIRSLRQRIGSAVGKVQTSSTELQTTANRQSMGAMEQATAMSEISTTITELLATSRQITGSAQRVADVADQTAGAGRSGQSTVASAQKSMGEIRRQVDVIVNHMIELGDKSQRIGAVLDIVSELAEQTNILAINSTIEAAGAGESGRRFAVVADEIRKLADRVAESTKEIRNLIEVVRGAVHTTVIATELGSKAVDAGTAQFAGVAAAFEQITELVTTTTEAAREIELSTRQQTTAVEQVNFAVSNVASTTRQNEASSSQTLLTASQLAELSTRLRRLVEPATTS